MEKYARATIVLHNYLRPEENASNGSIKKGHWRELANDNSLLTLF